MLKKDRCLEQGGLVHYNLKILIYFFVFIGILYDIIRIYSFHRHIRGSHEDKNKKEEIQAPAADKACFGTYCSFYAAYYNGHKARQKNQFLAAGGA